MKYQQLYLLVVLVNQHSYGESQVLPGKSTVNGQVLLVYPRGSSMISALPGGYLAEHSVAKLLSRLVTK